MTSLIWSTDWDRSRSEIPWTHRGPSFVSLLKSRLSLSLWESDSGSAKFSHCNGRWVDKCAQCKSIYPPSIFQRIGGIQSQAKYPRIFIFINTAAWYSYFKHWEMRGLEESGNQRTRIQIEFIRIYIRISLKIQMIYTAKQFHSQI